MIIACLRAHNKLISEVNFELAALNFFGFLNLSEKFIIIMFSKFGVIVILVSACSLCE